MLFRLSLLALCSIIAESASALNVPFRRERLLTKAVNFRTRSTTGGPGKYNFTNVNLGDQKDIYVGTIFMNGHPFEVQLDTGSSDLWLDTQGVSLNGFTNTTLDGFLQYGDLTTAEGPILLGNMTFGDFTVGNQAFISAPGSNASTSGDKGLLGVGPPGLSRIAQNLANSTYNGNPFLDNVFLQCPEEPNFISFALTRSDLGVTDGGIFTIGEVPQEFCEIDNAPALEVVAPSENQWTTLLDAVIVNGQTFSGQSFFSGIGNQTVALLDTGTSLAAAPSFYVDAMYKSVQGVQFIDGSYVLPCDAKIDISFVFGKNKFPVHPIDATFATLDNGTVVCPGSFQINNASESGVDFILGDAFLRNVYSLYDFGNWTTAGDSLPFMKILSVTNTTQADAEFASLNNARITQLQSSAQNQTTN